MLCAKDCGDISGRGEPSKAMASLLSGHKEMGWARRVPRGAARFFANIEGSISPFCTAPSTDKTLRSSGCTTV